ncbi:MAG: hypothetical protein ACI4VQ_04885 [Clostridia bacterium]
MKKTKEIEKKEDIINKVLNFTSPQDAEEFKKIASGRKFCKKGERLQDICDEEIEKFEYKKFSGIFTKIFKHHKLKKNREKIMLESRVSNVIRTVAVECINEIYEEKGAINREELVLKVKNTILDKVIEYNKISQPKSK